MATLKQRVYRINYSNLVLKPSGQMVEQNRTDYLPKVQNSDTVPSTLVHGKLYNTLTFGRAFKKFA